MNCLPKRKQVKSYFGGGRKGKRGHGAIVNIFEFGLLKRNGKVYIAVIPDMMTDSLILTIREKVTPDSLVYADHFRARNALDISVFHALRLNHFELFANEKGHIDGARISKTSSSLIYDVSTVFKMSSSIGC
ncbi:hypothetical protein NT6N_00970 [Oceaniferula spumae]|uniref:ISXO2-like transposase domain-containing protein n=1 Tax=Oceaniferula spumae TaxID=2979115 RepID=A0AAT9FGL7_9BACT